MNIPESKSRLRVPYIDSEEKREFAESITSDQLDDFLAEFYEKDEMGKIIFRDFHDHYKEVYGKVPYKKLSALCRQRLDTRNGTGNKLTIYGLRRL